jgi:hypothetical protein
MRLHILAATLLIPSAVSVAAANPLTMTVSPVQSFAPTILIVRVQVDPNADNRELEVVVESAAYYRRSRLQLEGASAPRTTSLEIRNLRSGNYEVRGVLIDYTGRPRAAVRTDVIVLE